MYVRGIVGLTLKDCVFDRPYRNGISVIDTVVRETAAVLELPHGIPCHLPRQV